MTSHKPMRVSGEQARSTARPLSTPPPRRLRVLVGAYALSPARGSEPGMGWHICRNLADHHDLTVLCAPGTPGSSHSVHRDEIDAYVKQNGPIAGLTIQYVERPLLSQLFQSEKEVFRRTTYYTGYKSWQKSAYRLGAALHRESPFDLAHHLNVTGFREPGYLWKLPIPFVWGPIGGAANIPPAYFPLMSAADRIFYRLRNGGNELQKRYARRCRAAAAHASHLWAIGAENKAMIEQQWGRPAEMLLESGTTPRPQSQARPPRDPAQPLRIIWSGLHIGRKALPILLRAMARLGSEARAQVVVLGSGPLSESWRALSHELKLDSKVRFAGHVSHDVALEEVAAADVMAFTSVQEGTPHAVLEALSLGIPVICHEACGMGLAVTDACGIKIPMTGPEQSIDGFAAALKRLIADPDLVARLSAGALQRSSELGWAMKARQIAETYSQVVDAALMARGGGGAL